MSERQRSVVTGAVGFVGANLVDALVARGDDVVSLDLAPKAHRDDVTYARVDITDYEAVKKALAGATTVFHNASVVQTRKGQEDKVWGVNLGGSQNILRACQELGVKKLVYVSSASAVYEGNDICSGDETMPYSTISQAPYADSKIAAEKELLAAHGVRGVAICALRPHVIFGPGDNRLIPNLLLRAKQGTLRFSVGRSRGKLSDYTYVSNFVDALLAADVHLALDSKVGGQAYFITNGEPMGFFDFVDIFLAEIGAKPILVDVPYPIVYSIAAIKEGLESIRPTMKVGQEDGMTRFAVKYMCTHHYFSIAKARRDFGYVPQVSIREGVKRTAAHLRATGQL